MAMTKRKCAICSHVFSGSLLDCPRCGSGVFESQKTQSQIHAQESESLSHDVIHSDDLASPETKTKRSWLSRVFGGRNNEKKNKCPKCGLDLSTVTAIVHSSAPTAKCPQCNTDITNKLEFFDTRTEEEKQIELDAQSSLTAEDEQLAKKLSYLSCHQDERDRTLPEAKAEIRKLGKYLCANGGTNRMKKIAYRVQALGGDVRTLQICWDGICGWMA